MKQVFQLLLLLITFTGYTQPTKGQKKQEIVFRSVNVIPMDKEQVLMNRDVVVKDGRITAILNTGKTKFGRNAVVIDGKGKFLMPGLAEMHAHVPPVDDLEPMKEVAMLFALNGITTIRGMLGHPRHLELRDKLSSGEIFGPRFITSGPSFNGQSIKSPEAASQMVRQQKAAGYDFLKLHPGLTRENFDAMVRTSKEVGIPFAGHVSFDVGAWHAIQSGYATIDHLDGFVEYLVPSEGQTEQGNGLFGLFIADRAEVAKIPALMAALREKQVWVVPTQALAERWMTPNHDAAYFLQQPEMKYMAATTLRNWANAKKNIADNPKYNAAAVNRYIDLRRKLIDACNKNGVGLLLGSDAPQVFNVPGFSTHQELRYMVNAGLSPFEALRTGTVNVGRFLKMPEVGVIRPGAVAEMVLLSANPLVNIANTQKIEGVLLANRWLSKVDIERELKKLEKK